MSNKDKCIDPKYVPCEKARAYLEKHGRLCGQKPAKNPPKLPKKVKSFLDEWLG